MVRIGLEKLICGFILVSIMVVAFNTDSQAKKYYSLEDIGVACCTSDNVDYAVLSIRGNRIQYVRYERETDGVRWKQTGAVKKARLTSKTKYYMGNADRLRNRSVDPDKSKWISRIRKGIAKKEYGGRNNEIVIVRGKVVKLIIRLNR